MFRQELKVTEIPTLHFVEGKNGGILTTFGKQAIEADPDGEKFPYSGFVDPSIKPISIKRRVLIRLLMFGVLFVFMYFYSRSK